MRYLVDTGGPACSLPARTKRCRTVLASFGKGNRLCISTITRLEVKAGAHPDEFHTTQKLLSRFVNLELDQRVADKAGELVYQGRRANTPILIPDAIIAATGLIHNLTLVTLNVQDFKVVAGS